MTTIVPAILGGVAVLFAGALPWGLVLAPLNQRVVPALPWAIVPMAVYLWGYWRYIGGRTGSAEDAPRRAQLLRARALALPVWTFAIVTGLTGFAAILAGTGVIGRLVTLPASAALVAPPDMPPATMMTLLVMASLVAGVSEEAGFRGYMQGPIELRYGLAPAILVNGLMFGLLHFPNHPGAVVPMLPYYVAVAAVYSGLTWATDSILPAIALHAGGDVWSLSRLWLTGQPEWQRSAAPAGLVWQTGLDGPFVRSLSLMVVFGVAAIAMCVSLRRLARRPPPD